MAGRIVLGIANPALDSNGTVDADCTMTFYENLTTTLQSIYDSVDLDTPLDNPLECDAAGRFPQIWGPDGAVYSVKIEFTGEAAITYDDIALTAVPDPATSYLPAVYCKIGKPTNAQTMFIFNVPFALTLPVGLNDGSYPSLFTVSTLPTATTAFTLYKNGVSIGSLSFSTAGVCTVTFASAVSFAAADQFSVVSQATADSTAANFAFTFLFAIA